MPERIADLDRASFSLGYAPAKDTMRGQWIHRKRPFREFTRSLDSFPSLREPRGEFSERIHRNSRSSTELHAQRQIHILPPSGVSRYVQESAHDILHVYTPMLPFLSQSTISCSVKRPYLR